MDKTPLVTKIDLDEKIGVYDWQSICVSLDLEGKVIRVVKNGKLIVVKYFDSAKDFSRLKQLMKHLYIGSFRGSVTETQVFSRPLGTDEMEKWTMCEDSNQVRLLNFF